MFIIQVSEVGEAMKNDTLLLSKLYINEGRFLYINMRSRLTKTWSRISENLTEFTLIQYLQEMGEDISW